MITKITEEKLKEISDHWKSIQDREERNNYYNSEVFPAIKEYVVSQEQKKHLFQSQYLILPVGLAPEPIILSILIIKPEKVYFLYTPGEKGSEQYLNRIVKETSLQIGQIDKDPIDETNVPDIYKKVKDIYEKWGKPEQIIIDISGGKKSMIGACTLASNIIGAKLVYMDSNFIQEFRKPEPGSEHLIILDNPYDVFGDLKFKRAIELYSQLDYVGAARILEELKKETSTPEEYEARCSLCHAYASWDDWQIEESQKEMQKAILFIENQRRLKHSTPLINQIQNLRTQDNVLNRLKQAQDVSENVLEFLNKPELFQPMIGTLRACALRHERRGKLDIAALLWYRLIELLSQQRLSRYQIDTKRPNYSNTGLPEEQLGYRYYCRLFESNKSKDTLPAKLPEDSISLIQGYALLMALNDPFTEKLHIGEIRSKVNSRNDGQFAHGFRPLSEESYVEFKKLADKLLSSFKVIETQNIADWNSCEFIGDL
jgi:CRISPR-associated protein (TIGR02710 family)